MQRVRLRRIEMLGDSESGSAEEADQLSNGSMGTEGELAEQLYSEPPRGATSDPTEVEGFDKKIRAEYLKKK